MDIHRIEIELTANCNAECPMCRRTKLGLPLNNNSTLSLNDIKEIFPTKKHIENKIIDLCGVLGDPIVAPDCFDVCKYFSDMGARYVSISTNGGYNSASWWKKLATIPRLYITWAADGFKDTNHMYRVNVSWHIVERNMRAYCAAGGKGKWKYLAFKHNEHDVDSAKKLAQELGLQFIIRTGRQEQLSDTNVNRLRNGTTVNLNKSSKYQHSGDMDSHADISNSLRDRNIEKIISSLPSIKCTHIKEGYVFISSKSTLWPCCYLYDRFVSNNDEYTTAYNNNAGPDWNSLKKYTIDEIIAHPNFVDIEKIWHPNHDPFLPTCLWTCGAMGARLNQIVDN